MKIEDWELSRAFGRVLTPLSSVFSLRQSFLISHSSFLGPQSSILSLQSSIFSPVVTDRLFNNLEVEVDDRKFYFDASCLEHKRANEKRELVYELTGKRDDGR